MRAEYVAFVAIGLLLGLAAYVAAGVGWYVAFYFANNPVGL